MTDALRRHSGLLIIALLMCGAFFHVALDFKAKWSLKDGYYSHGYLIPPISIYLLYRMREELSKLSPRPWNGGLAILIFGCLMRIVGAFSRINVLSGVSLIVVLLGLVLYLWGRKVTWKVLFPLLFLVAMVPAPTQFVNKVSFRMKMLAGSNSKRILNWFNYGIVQEGSKMMFERSDGEVDELVVGSVCSGLRSLIALIAFGALFAYVTEVTLWKRLALFAVSIPAAFIANLARILLITLIALHWNSAVAVRINYLEKLGLGSLTGEWGTMHDMTGIIVYIIAFVVLFSFEKLLAKIGPKPQRADEEAK